MRFEIGRYYKHTGVGMLHIISAAKTTMYGWTMIAEKTGKGYEGFLVVGSDETSATNYTEIKEEEWMKAFS